MKKILIATAAIAALAATSAQAQNASETWTIDASVSAQCAINTDDTTVDITGTDMVNDNGRLREGAVQNALLNGLNSKNTRAWCSGATNAINLSRTPLVFTGDSSELNGFASAVLFDVGIDIATIDGNPGGAAYEEGTADGPTGPTGVGRFGPLGQGAQVEFVADDAGTPGAAIQPRLIDPTGAANNSAASSTFVDINQNTRLAAGAYEGSVTLTLTAGI